MTVRLMTVIVAEDARITGIPVIHRQKDRDEPGCQNTVAAHELLFPNSSE